MISAAEKVELKHKLQSFLVTDLRQVLTVAKLPIGTKKQDMYDRISTFIDRMDGRINVLQSRAMDKICEIYRLKHFPGQSNQRIKTMNANNATSQGVSHVMPYKGSNVPNVGGNQAVRVMRVGAPRSVSVTVRTSTNNNIPSSAATVQNVNNMTIKAANSRTAMSRTPNGQIPTGCRPSNVQLKSSGPVYPMPSMNPKNLQLIGLPFYDVLDTIIPLTALLSRNGQNMQDHFNTILLQTASSAMYIRELAQYNDEVEKLPRVELQLRFFFFDPKKPQQEEFPSQPTIPTNKPGVEPKRPSRPVNITPYCIQYLNNPRPIQLSIRWNHDANRHFVYTVQMVRRLNADILRTRMMNKGESSEESTKALIMKKLVPDTDTDIKTDKFRVSLLCPLGKLRITTPAKTLYCEHLQCFDLTLFLMMNEKKPTWKCPVCDRNAHFDRLTIDGYFVKVLREMKEKCAISEVEVFEDGSYQPVSEEYDNQSDSPQPSNQNSAALNLPSSSNAQSASIPSSSVVAVTSGELSGGTEIQNNVEPDIVDLVSEDEEDDAKLKANNNNSGNSTNTDVNNNNPVKFPVIELGGSPTVSLTATGNKESPPSVKRMAYDTAGPRFSSATSTATGSDSHQPSYGITPSYWGRQSSTCNLGQAYRASYPPPPYIHPNAHAPGMYQQPAMYDQPQPTPDSIHGIMPMCNSNSIANQ